MKPLCSFDSSNSRIVIDTSVCINLNATGYAEEILSAIPNRPVALNIVLQELESGRSTGRSDAELTTHLVHLGLIEVVQLGELGLRYFEDLVSGSAEQTLGDGEAATIAFAIEFDEIALIDERKATRMCARRFTELQIASTVDVFMHPEIQRVLGRDSLKQAVLSALQVARMSVPPHQLAWVTDLIGVEETTRCKSLPVGCMQKVKTAN